MIAGIHARARSRGFTLVEAIVSIVLIGILSAVVAVFIRAPILGYRDSVDRAEITDQADLALRRMARDLRLALPNSVRVSSDGSALEFLQTRSGGRYLSSDDAGVDPSIVLSFDDPSDTTFTAIAPLGSFAQVVAGQDYLVVYNLGPGLEPANAYALPSATCSKGSTPAANTAGNIALITSVASPSASGLADAVDITLATNPFACQSPPMPSPAYRFQVVSGPVSFYCLARSDGTLDLWRAWGYGIASSQPLPPSGGQRALIASRLTHCTGLFNYSTAANQRTGLVGIALELHGRNDSVAAIRLVHQVHVDNTP